MAITSTDLRALKPGGRLEGDRVGDVRVAVERSADGLTFAWLRETLDARGRVVAREVTRTVRKASVRGPHPKRYKPPAPSGLPPGTFGHILRTKRAAAGLTARELAARTGVAVATVQSYEKKKRHDPAWSVIQKLAKAFGCPTDDFRQDIEPETPAVPPKKGGGKSKRK